MPIEAICAVQSVEKLTPNTYKLSFFSNDSFLPQSPHPGQFVDILCDDQTCRRPFSFAGSDSNKINSIVFEVKGIGTKWLSELKSQSKINVIFPLGNGFDVVPSAKTILAVGGGTGVAPILHAAKFITDHTSAKVDVVLGFSSKSQAFPFSSNYRGIGLPKVLCTNDEHISRNQHFGNGPTKIKPSNTGLPVIVCTDDGSAGFKGTVTDFILATAKIACYDLILACGPHPMLEAIAHIAHGYNIPCQVSLEEYFGCGFGVCLGCAIDTKSGKKCVCKDGPIFDSKEVFFNV
jgi:dihydroorotate dehydrogenase electron transfer subunit